MTTCTGTRYAVNPDFPDEGTDTEGGAGEPGPGEAGPSEDGGGTGDAAGEEPTDAPSPALPLGAVVVTPGDALVCAGCGKPILVGEAALFSDDDEPYHADEAPFL